MSMIRRRRRSRYGYEQLEARRVLEAQLFITEMGANAQVGLADEDGDASDWIELYNAGDTAVEMAGWSLTDDVLQPTKWRFPPVTVAPHEYLVVYASGKDRTAPEAPLHTNFKLDERGEYLGLTQPDGLTAESAFTPSYPAQLPGATYGLPQAEDVDILVPFDGPRRYSVPPAAARPSSSRTWTQKDFDDTSWFDGKGTIGFDTTQELDSLIVTDVQSVMADQNATIYVRLDLPLDITDSWSWLKLRLRYDDGYVVYLNATELARRNASGRVNSQSSAIRERERDGAPGDEETIYIHRSQLQVESGVNVVAIQGMNLAAEDQDFLIGAEFSVASAGDLPSPNEFHFFAQPSPGRANGLETVIGRVPSVKVNVPHGFYEESQRVTLSSSLESTVLVYTTDGSSPSPTHGTIIRNNEGIPSTTLEINSVTTLRAAAFKEGWLPSEVTTTSYLFLADVLQQSADGSNPEGWPAGRVNSQMLDYGMDPDIVNSADYGPLMFDALTQIPSISLVTDLENLFEPSSGIYVNGLVSRTNESLWERPASLELIDPSGVEGFQIDAGIRLRGGYGREGDNAKHAFRLFFRSSYGAAELNYPLFGSEGADRFQKLDLRTPSVPSWSFCPPDNQSYCRDHTILRNVFGRDTLGATGQAYTRSRYYHLYLNGQYWGIYQSEERPDAEYAATYFGGEPEDYDVIKVESFPHQTIATNGTIDAWRTLWEAAKNGFDDDADYQRIQGNNPDGTPNPDFAVLLDVDNLIDYLITIFYTGDRDGPISDWGDNEITNNWFGIRNRNSREGFRFFVHDGEWGLFNPQQNRLGPWPAGETFNQSNPQWIHQRLMANSDYRTRFADHVYRHLSTDGALSTEAALARLNQRVSEIDLAIIAESARWGDSWRSNPYTKSDWLTAVKHIQEVFIPQRREILLEQFRNATLDADGHLPAPLYPEVSPPTISQPGGLATPGTEVSLSSDDDVFYTLDGLDPRGATEQVSWNPVVADDAPSQYFVPLDGSLENSWYLPDFDDSAWSDGANGIGFGSRLQALVTTDVSEPMLRQASSLYVRFTFQLDQPDAVNRLRARLRFDDGIVAYLNGTEVFRSNAPEQVHWDSQSPKTVASNSHFETNLSDFVHLLRSGNNVLAIQGLNRRSNDVDFLVLPELWVGTITDLGISKTAHAYSSPIVIDHNTVLKARSLRNGVWSPLIEAVYDTRSVPLRVDELMYHPAGVSAEELTLGYQNGDEFEFIELVNTSSTETLDLTGFELRGAIDFQFPSVSLPAGHRIVVARNIEAFSRRYGNSARVAGEYALPDGRNRLDNAGETVQLHDSLGLLVQQFTYDDSWQPLTDGGGFSLQIIDSRNTDLDRWSQPENWQVSLMVGGTPGTPNRYAGDANGDGLFDSRDLVFIFQTNEYEDGIALNSTFEEGDWDGDGDFSTADLVLAFSGGRYETSQNSERALGRPALVAAVDAVFSE